MKLLVLGKGKTGSLVAEVAREGGHQVSVLDSASNRDASGLTAEALRPIDVVIDFTTPQAVLANIAACAREKKAMVVGTTGWHAEIDHVRLTIEQSGSGFVYGSNFSVGVNVFFEAVHAAGIAAKMGYVVKIVERHHAQKKDSPSGTAATMQRLVSEASGLAPEITSIREGDVVGTHVLLLDSANDTMMFTHDAKSRRGFAEGAVRAAQWVRDKRGFYEFRQIFKQL
jgi:4-hydroxy-tetrahydrodipicolinate reductase